ncbi:MAG TPA: hypothetical protein VFP87_05340 [Chitinophagaceae bacterium]|nr:hypothetical protein [Chitinophagaceae bacterium]
MTRPLKHLMMFRFLVMSLIPNPKKTITHAVTINASANEVWPWIAQLGAGRAGWYSYDQIDNGGIPSAKTIIPRLQHIEVGDLMPAVPGSKDAFIIREIHVGKALVLVVPVTTAEQEPSIEKRMTSPLRVSWTLVLSSLNRGRTRLISRGRISNEWLTYSPPAHHKPIFIERVYQAFSRMPWFVVQPIAMSGHHFMESRMLRGIKRRVEHDA